MADRLQSWLNVRLLICQTFRLRDAARLFDFQASGCYRLKGCNISFRLLDYLHNKHSSCLSTCQSLRLSSCWAARLSNSRAVSWQIVGLSGWKKAVKPPYCQTAILLGCQAVFMHLFFSLCSDWCPSDAGKRRMYLQQQQQHHQQQQY